MRAEGEGRQGEGRQHEEEEPSSCSGRLARLSRPILRLWVGYFTTFTALLSVTVLLGLMPQFVSIPYVSGAGFGAMVLQLVAYPLIVGLQALKVQVLAGMPEEADSGFPRLRATVLAALQLPPKAAGAVEKGIAVLLGLCVAVGIGLGVRWTTEGSALGLVSGFIAGSLLAFSVLAAIEIIAEFVVSVASVRAPMQPSLDLEATKGMPLEREPMIAAAASGHGRGHDSGGRGQMLVGATWLGFTVLLQLCVALLAHNFSVPSFLPSIAMVIAFLAMGSGLSQLFNGLVEQRSWTVCPCASPFRVVIGLFASMCLLVLVIPDIIGELQSSGSARLTTPMLAPPPDGTTFNRSHVPISTLLGYGTYPVCHNMEWNIGLSDEAKHLQLLDIIAFAQAVYWPDRADVESEARSATSGTDLGEVHLEVLEDPDAIGRVGVFVLPQAKARVVAIRGSSQADDWAFNFDMWGPSFFFNILRSYMPFAELVPMEFVRRVLALDLRELAGLPQPWHRLQELVLGARVRSQADGFSLIITGHSLGGGLAQIVGPSGGIPTVVFSPVGISFAKMRAGLAGSPELPVANTVVVINPLGDLVPAVLDDQPGVVQNIMCTARSPATCHSLHQTACELFRKCGDPRGRSMESTCSKQVGDSWQAVPWQGFAWRS